MFNNFSEKFPNIKKFALLFLFISTMYLVAASSFHGFFAKWTFRDSLESNCTLCFSGMLEGTASRPFVHRRLIIDTSNAIAQILPESAKKPFYKLSNRISKEYGRSVVKPDQKVQYAITYLISFVAYFLALLIFVHVTYTVTGSLLSATVGTSLFALLFPVLETGGGYYYDLGELFFFSISILACLKRKYYLLLLITPFATFNKESFFFFIPTLAPFIVFCNHKCTSILPNRHEIKNILLSADFRKAIFTLGSALLIAGIVYLFVKYNFAKNPGGTTSWWLPRRIDELFVVSSYFHLESTYGLKTPGRMNIISVISALSVILLTWSSLPKVWQLHFVVVAVIQLPLYWLFCMTGELRNLSFFFPLFILMLSLFIQNLILDDKRAEKP